MITRHVDILNANHTVLHTYPITIKGADNAPTRADFEKKALEAAEFAALVPPGELHSLITRIHVDRRGSFEPYGDDRAANTETREDLDHAVSERAYFLWQEDGSPEGRATEYWYRAHDQQLRARAYRLWEEEGRPEGRADEYWHRTEEFERS